MASELDAVFYAAAIDHKVVEAEVSKENNRAQLKPSHARLGLGDHAPNSRNNAHHSHNAKRRRHIPFHSIANHDRCQLKIIDYGLADSVCSQFGY